MAITLNGTTGISSPGGDTSTSLATTNLSYTGTLTGGTGVIAIGTNQIYKDASGNIGIGTASPSVKLHVFTSASSTAALLESTSASADNVQLRFKGFSGERWAIGNNVASGGTGLNFDIFDLVSSNNRLRIDVSGNVGIGTTSPAAKLDVAGSLRLSTVADITCGGTNGSIAISAGPTYNSGGAIVCRGSANATNAYGLEFNTNGNQSMTLTGSGNLGIGATSPSYKLSIKGASATSNNLLLTWDTNATDAYAKIRSQFAEGNASCSTEIRFHQRAFNGDGGYQTFWTTNSGGTLLERMRIDSNGGLLVGTTSAPVAGALLRAYNAANADFSFGPNGSSSFIVYNSSSVGVYLSNGTQAWAGSSDERLKTDLITITNAVQKVATLRAVTGRFKTDAEGFSRAFLIAQDVQKVLPEAVDSEDPEKLGVRYTDTIPLLVAAIKELTTRLEALEAKA